jgi:hypothetical protein
VYITFEINGHCCASCPRTGHNESQADTAKPFSRSPDEKRTRATELVTAAKMNPEKPHEMEKALKNFRKSW